MPTTGTITADQSALYRILDPVKQRFVDHLDRERQEQVRSNLNEFVRLYTFLSQIITFHDAELERLYLFSRYLKRVLPVEREHLPREIQEQIDMESYGIRETRSGGVTLDRGAGTLDPRAAKGPMPTPEHEKERLSAIIQELNDRFGAGLTEKDRISLERAKDQLQDMATSNFQLYKRIADDRAFGKALLDFLFEGFWRGRRGANQTIHALRSGLSLPGAASSLIDVGDGRRQGWAGGLQPRSDRRGRQERDGSENARMESTMALPASG